MMSRGVPAGLDADTTQRVLRTFLVVRIVRGGLLLIFLAVALVGVESEGWPTGVAVAVALAMLVQAGLLVTWCRRYASTGNGSRNGTGP